MATIKTIINRHPNIVALPGTDLTELDFSAGTVGTKYRIHSEAEKVDKYPSEELDATLGLQFTLAPFQYLSMWSDRPFYISADDSVEGTADWNPLIDASNDIVLPELDDGIVDPTVPYSLDTLTEIDSAPLSSDTHRLAYTPAANTILTGVTIRGYVGLGSADITATLYDSAGTAIFTSGTQSFTSVKSNVLFDFTSSPTLIAGTAYTIGLSSSGSTANFTAENSSNVSSEIGSFQISDSGVDVADLNVALAGLQG